LVVTVKRGLVRAGRILIDGTNIRVRRDRQGSYVIPAFGSQGLAHVQYFFMRDRLVLKTARGEVEITFGRNLATFEFDARTYQIESMSKGDIIVRERDRIVIEGRVTVSGVRLQKVSTDLEPIQIEFAFGLALRSEDLSRQSHLADVAGTAGG